jgi:glycosyltransferase involved in cell wall biosynthesis
VILLSYPIANENVRQTACALSEAELLAEFWTCVHWRKGGFLDGIVTDGMRDQLRRRSFPGELTPLIKTVPWRELGRHIAGRLHLNWLTKHETGLFSMDAIFRSLDRRVARRLSAVSGLKAVYAYEDGALESFRVAKQLGIKCIYDYPIVYWRKVRELEKEEAQRTPEWASTLPALSDSDEKLARKDAELALADVVLAPSTFAKQSLAQCPSLKATVNVIPYGASAPRASFASEPEPNGKLRVLFVGALSQAKGLGYLLEAAAKLDRQIKLTLIGRRVSDLMPPPATLQRHHWIPSLPHDALLEEMSRHDVLVLPSLHEGFGLVITEAMASGLVVIASSHSAAPDLITDGTDGFVISVGSARAIEEKIDILCADRSRLMSMKEAAKRTAEAHSWRIYRERLASVAQEVIAR